MGDLARSQSEGGLPRDEGDRDKGDYSESNYDDFSGYGGAVRAHVGSVNHDTFGPAFIQCLYSFCLLPLLTQHSSLVETRRMRTTIERQTRSTRLLTTVWMRGESEGTCVWCVTAWRLNCRIQ